MENKAYTSTDEILIRLFYSRRLDDYCISIYNENTPFFNIDLCDSLLMTLLKYPCKQLVSMIKKDHIPFEISSADIPQFSSLDDSCIKVPEILFNAGIDGVSYTQMGYMLRVKPRKEMADMKYGENQSKTAAQMGLSHIDEDNKVWLSNMGYSFHKLDYHDKIKLFAPLALYIPILQNYFVMDEDDSVLSNHLSCLAESTQKRRMTNINRLITLIKNN